MGNLIKIGFIIFIFSFFNLRQSFALEILIVDKENEDVYLSEDNYDVIEDRDNVFTIQEITSAKFRIRFDTSKVTSNSDHLNIPYWYRFSIKNCLSKNKQLMYELLSFQVDKAALYIPDESGNYIKYEAGDDFSFSFRNVDHKNFLFFLPHTDSSRVLTCYMKIEVKHKIGNRSRAVVRSEERFISYALKEYYLLGMFYGLLLIMLIYNIILYITIRSNSYIYYVLYILSVAFYSLSWNGIGFQYLWSWFPVFNYYALPTASYCLILWASLYAKSFLLTSERSKILNRIFIWVIIIRTIIFIIGLTFYNEILYFFQIDIIPLLLGFIAGVISLINQFRPARFYIIAYTSLFTGFVILTLVHQKILTPNIFTVYSLEIGVVIELIFFSAALADRYKVLKISEAKTLQLVIQQLQENEKLKDKVNKELEVKVVERTQEINEANKKLNEQAEKITQMNLLLDLDNRKLQKNVKDLYTARIFAKDVDIEEFNNLYPNEESCYRYLSFLKWEEVYKCKKCINDKFFWGKTPFSRRCTKCGYEESVTAHTIFHNMRIPILKAFHMAFLIYSSNDKIPSTELSRILSIRQKTCWEYKKIIFERINQKKKELKKDKIGGWDKLILD